MTAATAVTAWLALPDVTLADLDAWGIDRRAVIPSHGLKSAKVRFDKARDELWHVGQLAAQDEVLGRRLEKLMVQPRWAGTVLVPRKQAA